MTTEPAKRSCLSQAMPLKLILCDINRKVVRAWEAHLEGAENVALRPAYDNVIGGHVYDFDSLRKARHAELRLLE